MKLNAPIQLSVWQDLGFGVWKMTIGTPTGLSPMKIASLPPLTSGLKKLPEVNLPLSETDLKAEWINSKLHLRLPVAEEDVIHGLGLNFRSLNQQQMTKHLKADHYTGKDNGHTHAPLPFYLSSQGYGILLDTAKPLDVWVGSLHTKEQAPPLQDRFYSGWKATWPGKTIDFLMESEGLEVYLFGGPSFLEIVRRYILFTGGGCLPPKWGLGFWHRTHLEASQQDVERVAGQYLAKDFPLSALGLEPGWHSNAYPTSHEWRTELFPEPEAMVQSLKDKNIHVNLWHNLFIPNESPLGVALGENVLSHTGSWGGVIPDLMLPDSVNVLKAHLEKYCLALGISGFKHDEVEDPKWLFPKFATLPSGTDPEEYHMLLGVLIQKLTDELYRQKNTRTYGLVRGTHLGSAHFANALYNDSYTHEEFLTALCSSSFSGLLWTPEVRNSTNAEEWLRRIQAVCFSPLAMLNAWASEQMPWSFPEVTEGVRAVMKLRQRLTPYLYSAFAKYHFDGIPPIRAMALEPDFIPEKITPTTLELDGTHNPYSAVRSPEVKDQWMFGQDILVTPFIAGTTKRKVIFPKGKWFDFYTGIEVNGTVIEIDSNLGPIPLYVRDGALIPMLYDNGKDLENTFSDLEVRHYGNKEGKFEIYDDDGVTFDFEKELYALLEIKLDNQGRVSITQIGGKKESKLPQLTWKKMTQAGK